MRRVCYATESPDLGAIRPGFQVQLPWPKALDKSPNLSIRASCGCSHTLPQTAWLKPAQVCSPTARGVGSPTRVSRGANHGVRAAFLPEALGESPFPRLFQLLEAACVLWHVAPSSRSQQGCVTQTQLPESVTCLSLSFLSPSSTAEAPRDYSGPPG